ncbi:MAG: hypothetical protein AB8B96_16725 [Lysobacterales bacterium]
MARPKKTSKTKRTRYPDQFKAEALGLADRLGEAAAARELDLHPSQL